MRDQSMLDNPVWHALKTQQHSLDCGKGLAARYPADVSRFVGLAALTHDAFSDLAEVVQPGGTVALATAEPPEPPPSWRTVNCRPLEQMVCSDPKVGAVPPSLRLGESDVPEMLALAAATKPGPFLPATIRMGRYFGIRSSEEALVAMAGERLRLDGFTEISAVCTDPAFRGRGYARTLLAALVSEAAAEGCTPFLHVKSETGAKGVYEALGFRVRRRIRLTVLTKQ